MSWNLEWAPGADRWVIVFEHNPSIRRARGIEGMWLNNGDVTRGATRDALFCENICHRRQPPVVNKLDPVALLQSHHVQDAAGLAISAGRGRKAMKRAGTRPIVYLRWSQTKAPCR